MPANLRGAHRAEWTSSRSYAARIDDLKGIGSGERLNGAFFLGDDTVLDDHALDILLGGFGLDWFWLTPSRDLLLGRRPGERID